MDLTTTQLLLVAGFIVGGAVLFGMLLLVVVLRVGPRRGSWNQPAAVLRRPGRGPMSGMYLFAALHVLAGIGIVLFVPGASIGMLVLLVVTAGFYVLCAHSYALAHRVTRGRRAPN